uniref:Uncharacterized protein n=1 Tax=Panagrolaimus davidi TaxID=227884 RepID=A0A914PGQ4_9BILA
MDNLRVHMMDYPGSDGCTCCIAKRVAVNITSKQELMTSSLSKMMDCKGESCKCCSEACTFAKDCNISNSQMSMCVKVFKTHQFKVNVNEIDSSVLLFMYLNEASDVDLVDAVYKHFILLENFVDYQSAFLLKRLKECVINHRIHKTDLHPIKYPFFRQLLVHLSVSKYSSWKKLRTIFEQIFDIGINVIDTDEFTKDMLNHFPRNVKTCYVHLAAICGYKYSYHCLQQYYGTFVKVLNHGLKHQETASVSKDLFLALAQQAENYNYNPIRKWFFTFCKNTFGSSVLVIRQRATHYWLPDFAKAYPKLFVQLCKSKAYQYSIAELYLIYSKLTNGFSNLGRHCKERFRRTKLLTFIKNATEKWIKPSINVYNPRREIAFDTLLVLYLQDHDARDYVEFFWKNAGIEKRIKILKMVEEKCGGLSMSRWEELINDGDYELDYFRLYTELRTLRPTNPYKFNHESECDITLLVNNINSILKNVGSSAVGHLAKVTVIREKFLRDAWSYDPNFTNLEAERFSSMIMKEFFYGQLFTMMYQLIDRNFSSPETFRAIIKAVYSIILRVEDKKVIDFGIGILKHAC